MKEVCSHMKHIFVINPAAGKYDHSAEFTEKIQKVFAGRPNDYEIYITKCPGDGERFANERASTGEELRFYACGGDGTLNGVVNGLVGHDNAAVTHMPCGSGNDTVKMFSDSKAFFSLERLLDAEETYFDLIRCNDFYSIDILSVGFDAKVGTDVARFKKLPCVSGKGAYILSIAANIVHGLSEHYTVSINGKTVDADETLICVCNGRWYGGGFNPVPDAEPDDGLLDVLMVKKVNLIKALEAIGHYQKGEYRRYPELIAHERCTALTIECRGQSVVNVDGEARYTQKAEISIVPGAIRFFYPRGLTFHCT